MPPNEKKSRARLGQCCCELKTRWEGLQCRLGEDEAGMLTKLRPGVVPEQGCHAIVNGGNGIAEGHGPLRPVLMGGTATEAKASRPLLIC